MFNFFSPRMEISGTSSSKSFSNMLTWLVHTLMIAGVIWVSMGSYYYWSPEGGYIAYAALWTGVSCLFLGFFFGVLDMYYQKQILKNTAFHQFILENQHIIEELYQKGKEFIGKKTITHSLSTIAVVLATVYMLGMARRNGKHD